MDIIVYIHLKTATFKHIWICHIYKKQKLQGQILTAFCSVPLSNLFKSKDLPSAQWFGKIQPQTMELKQYLSCSPTDEEKAAEKINIQNNLVGTWQFLSLFIPFMGEAHVF